MEYVVSGNQERYLLAERFTEASYPIPFSYQVKGRLDVGRLQRAIDDVVARHDILRSEFRTAKGGFVASIRPQARIVLSHQTMAGADPATVRDRVAQYFEGKISKFSPESFAKALIVSTSPDNHVLTLSLHHATGDGVSMDIFAEEVFTAYRGEALQQPRPSYYEVIAAQPASDAQMATHAAYWKQQLADIEDVASLRPDMDDPTAPHGEVVFPLDYRKVRQVASEVDATPFTVMATIAAVVLGRYCASDDVQLTFQSSGRTPFPASVGAIGPFSNSLVLRTRLSGAEGFDVLARTQRAAIAEALSHETYPYHLVVRETGVQPRFGINWFPTGYRPQAEGLEVSDRDFLFYDSNYDLNIRFVRGGDTLRMLLHFDATQFSRPRIEQIAKAFADAVEAVSEQAGRSVNTVLPPARPLLAPKAPKRTRERIFDAFLAQAAAEPDRIALVGDDRRMTYREVEQASAVLARRLVAAGLGIGDRVAILAERGPTLVSTMLAVTRIGATMVPLDSDYPEERLKTLLQVSRANALLLPRKLQAVEWAADVPLVLVVRDDAANAQAPEASAGQLSAGDPDNPAYLLFTSGSTGAPKCIATSHRPVLNFLRWQRETFGLTADDRFTNLCGLAHDMMVRDVFAPLSIGAQLAIPHQDDIFKPGALLEWCLEQQPSITHLTPAMGKLLAMAQQPDQHLPLRLMFFGGDRLQPEIVKKMRLLAPAAEIVNFYGATETPQAAAFHRCDPEANWLTHPIGHGIDNFSLRIVDENHDPVPDGAPGEIAVLTPFLSLGYVRDGRIQPHPQPGAYYTGDTGFELPSGEIMFTGRTDDQINIRGYRIELEEVNATLRAHPRVREAQVLIEGDATAPRLIAFAAGEDLDDDDLYAWMGRKLPHYMVPGDILCLKDLPLLPNGKLDRKTLLAMPRPSRARGGGREAETDVEIELVAAWEENLSAGRVSPEQSFAELRGDSLSYVQVFLATEAIVGALPEDWQTMPLADIAKLKKPKANWYRWVDSAMLVRATTIVLVVTLHLHVFSIGGGATAALFMVSGFLVGRLQLREAVRTKSSLPMWRLTGRVLLPSAIYTTLFYFTKLATHKVVSLSVLLLYGDFVDYRSPQLVAAEGHAWFLWFIACFVHMAVGASLITYVAMKYFGNRLTVKSYAATLFLIALPLRFVLPGLINPQIYLHGIPPMSVYGFMPTAHFATFALGACLANAETQREKAIYAAVTLAYATATYFFVPSHGFILLALFGLMLLYARRLAIPRGLHLVVLFLSGASLFIYLTHQQAAQVFELFGVPTASIPLVLLVLLFGIGLWLGWQRLSSLSRRWSGRTLFEPMLRRLRLARGAS